MVHGGYRASSGVLGGPAARTAFTGAAGVWARDSQWDKPGIIRFFGGADLARPARTDLGAARTGRFDLVAGSAP